MTGDSADQVDGIEYDPRPSVVHNSNAIDIAPLTIRRRRRKYANELGRKWPNLLFPPRWQFAGSIVFLPQAWGQIAGAGVITPNRPMVLAPEVVEIVVATLVIALLIFLTFAFALALVFGKGVDGRQRAVPKQGNQELPPIHVSLSHH